MSFYAQYPYQGYQASPIFTSVHVDDGSAASPSIGPSGALTTGFFFVSASNIIGLSNAGVETMRTDSYHQVLINATSFPQYGDGFGKLGVVYETTAGGSTSEVGTYSRMDISGTTVKSGQSSGIEGQVRRLGLSASVTETSTVLAAIKTDSTVQPQATFTYTNTTSPVGVCGARIAYPRNPGAGTAAITGAAAVYIDLNSSGNLGTNKYGIYMVPPTGSTNNYGLFMSNAGSTNYSIKTGTGIVDFGGTIVSGNYQLAPNETNIGNSGTSFSVNWASDSAQLITLTGNVTSITFSNPQKGGNYILRIATGAGAFTVTGWPAAVLWPSGVAPTITVAASKVDLIRFYYDGTNYYGSYTQNY